MSEEGQDSPGAQSPRRVADLVGRHGRKVAVGVVTLVAAPVAATLIANALSADHGGTSQATKIGPGLQVEKLLVHNGSFQTVPTQVTLGGVKQPAWKQTHASMPWVDLTIFNSGSQRAVITGMVFTVRDYAEIRPCQAGAATLLNGEYQVPLPVPARRGQVVALNVDRNIAPDDIDRFALRFSVPFNALNLGGEQLYVLDVAANVASVRAPQRIDTIAIGVPGIPTDEDLQGGVHGDVLPACYARHRRDLERIAEYPSARMDPALTAVSQQAARIDAATRTRQ
jgi:hypothetical protein